MSKFKTGYGAKSGILIYWSIDEIGSSVTHLKWKDFNQLNFLGSYRVQKILLSSSCKKTRLESFYPLLRNSEEKEKDRLRRELHLKKKLPKMRRSKSNVPSGSPRNPQKSLREIALKSLPGPECEKSPCN